MTGIAVVENDAKRTAAGTSGGSARRRPAEGACGRQRAVPVAVDGDDVRGEAERVLSSWNVGRAAVTRSELQAKRLEDGQNIGDDPRVAADPVRPRDYSEPAIVAGDFGGRRRRRRSAVRVRLLNDLVDVPVGVVVREDRGAPILGSAGRARR
jgi:hypothetical protein